MFLQLSIQGEEKNLKIKEKDCVQLDLLVELDRLCGEKILNNVSDLVHGSLLVNGVLIGIVHE